MHCDQNQLSSYTSTSCRWTPLPHLLLCCVMVVVVVVSRAASCCTITVGSHGERERAMTLLEHWLLVYVSHPTNRDLGGSLSQAPAQPFPYSLFQDIDQFSSAKLLMMVCTLKSLTLCSLNDRKHLVITVQLESIIDFFFSFVEMHLVLRCIQRLYSLSEYTLPALVSVNRSPTLLSFIR